MGHNGCDGSQASGPWAIGSGYRFRPTAGGCRPTRPAPAAASLPTKGTWPEPASAPVGCPATFGLPGNGPRSRTLPWKAPLASPWRRLQIGAEAWPSTPRPWRPLRPDSQLQPPRRQRLPGSGVRWQQPPRKPASPRRKALEEALAQERAKKEAEERAHAEATAKAQADAASKDAIEAARRKVAEERARTEAELAALEAEKARLQRAREVHALRAQEEAEGRAAAATAAAMEEAEAKLRRETPPGGS